MSDDREAATTPTLEKAKEEQKEKEADQGEGEAGEGERGGEGEAEGAAIGVLQIDPQKPLAKQLINSYWLADLSKSVHAIKGVTKGLPEKVSQSKSNHIVLIENCDSAEVIVVQNQRFSAIYIVNCVDCEFQLLDSVVVASRTVRVINCVRCRFVFETVDVRKCEAFDAVGCEFVYISEPALVDEARVLWREGCLNNRVTVADLRVYAWYKVHWDALSTVAAPNTTTAAAAKEQRHNVGGDDRDGDDRDGDNENKPKEEEKEEGSEQWITCFDELLKIRHVKLVERNPQGDGWRLTPEGAQEMRQLIPVVMPCLPGEEELDSCYRAFYRDFAAEHRARRKRDKEEAKRKRKEEKAKKKKEEQENEEGEEKGKASAKNQRKKTKKNEQEEKTEAADPAHHPLRLPRKEEILGALRQLEANPPNLSEKQLEMAYDAERNEYEEDEETIKRKARKVAAMMRTAKHTVVFSGAGISTSADIPDFRGPQGVWTQQAKYGAVVGPSKSFRVGVAKPTYAHYAITELTRRHLVKFVISTNMDALHLRSGLAPHLIMEQHGNSYKEICKECKMTYMRPYRVTDEVVNRREHYTTRMCSYCVDGKLMDTIVHFSENFRGEHDVAISLQESAKADLALVMGTSMNVQPNAVYAGRVFKNADGRMVLVNLQKTPYDKMCAVRVFARTDTFMHALMAALTIGDGFDRTFDALDDWEQLEMQRTKEKEEKQKKETKKKGFFKRW